ncbi:hypothetical protein ES703_53433 [subsurface metagenome]
MKELRAQREWTQNEVANRAGIGRGYYAQLETDVVAKPSADTLLKLARALKIRPEELYHAAGYIIDTNVLLRVHKETPEDILDRLRVSISSTVPVYEDFPFHAGSPVEPVDHVPIVKERARGRNLEGYIARGNCLEPEISDGNIIIVDRDGQIDNGDIVAALVDDMLHLGRLRKIADELWLESNHGRFKLEEAQVVAPIIEVRRKLK